MEYDIVIGLEIHVELKTRTKLFCGCKNQFGGEPNTRCCPICLGMPGTLPVLNKHAVELAIKAGLALNCKINEFSKFDRKNYFYPDMSKAYQITQFNLPICKDGYVDIDVDGEIKRIEIERIHIEEDAGKLSHDPEENSTLIDYNRCGVPLVEIVTRPDLRTPEEARRLVETIKAILEYTEVSDCKMQEGSLRVDVNLSVRPKGIQALGVRTEMKNLNSLRSVQRAAQAEAKRQMEVLEKGGKVLRETRRWDENKGTCIIMRSKEESMDYRFFPEPDLLPLIIGRDWIESIKNSLPELPKSRSSRYERQLGIPKYDADLITINKKLADIFDKAVAVCQKPKLVSNWIMTDILRRVNETGEGVLEGNFNGDNFGLTMLYLDMGEITHAAALKVIDVIFETGEDPRVIIERLGLKTEKNESLLKEAVEKVLEENPQAWMDYTSGKEKALVFLMGKTMALLKGRGDPAQVRDILLKKISNQ